jgi:hypothetical protein
MWYRCLGNGQEHRLLGAGFYRSVDATDEIELMREITRLAVIDLRRVSHFSRRSTVSPFIFTYRVPDSAENVSEEAVLVCGIGPVNGSDNPVRARDTEERHSLQPLGFGENVSARLTAAPLASRPVIVVSALDRAVGRVARPESSHPVERDREATQPSGSERIE